MATFKCYLHFFRAIFIIPYYLLELLGLCLALYTMLTFDPGPPISDDARIWIILLIGISISIAILLPLFFGLGGRTVEIIGDRILLNEKPVVFFSQVRKFSKEYTWNDVAGWRLESVVSSMHESVKGLRLYLKDGRNFLLWGKHLFKDGEKISEVAFIDALMPRLEKVKTDREFFNKHPPVNAHYYLYLTLYVVVGFSMVFSVVALLTTGKIDSKLIYPLGMGTIALVAIGKHITKN